MLAASLHIWKPFIHDLRTRHAVVRLHNVTAVFIPLKVLTVFRQVL
jgi:hypothetical protein